jgi:glycosyltransferase involved in cell wall biosynthesis
MSGGRDGERVDVLVLSSFPPGVGGGELQTREQLLRMVRRGRRVHVIDLTPRHDGAAIDDDEGIVVHRVRTPRAPVVRSMAYHARIARLSFRLGRRARVAQLNHLGTGMIAAAPVLAMLGVGRTLVIWGSAAPGFGPFGPGWRNRIARWIARRQPSIVSLSSATARNLAAAGFDASRVRFIPNGVDTERFRPLTPADGAWNPPPGWPRHGTIAVTVGRLVPAKGLDLLFTAWRSAIDAAPDATLVIVGDGPLREECEAAARRLGIAESVKLLGTRRDVPEILRRSDLYVSSSRTEGMSNALLEGLASGLPLVATRVGGAEDTVDDRVNGILVPEGDAPALASALQELLTSSETRRAMGEASRRLALSRFALDTIVDRYAELFSELERPA